MRALLILGLLALAPPAMGDTLLASDSPPTPFNRINLFMNTSGPTFGTATPQIFGTPWTTSANTGTFIQLTTAGLVLDTFLLWNQQILNPLPSYAVSYQVGVFNGASFSVNYTGQATLSPGGFGLIAPVPEPSSLLLCGLGAGALVARAWRRRGRASVTGA